MVPHTVCVEVALELDVLEEEEVAVRDDVAEGVEVAVADEVAVRVDVAVPEDVDCERKVRTLALRHIRKVCGGAGGKTIAYIKVAYSTLTPFVMTARLKFRPKERLNAFTIRPY
jgi:hypothetical protein